MEKQLLDNTQISAVLKIVKRDIFHNLYTQAIDEIKNGEEWIDKELSITNRIDEINKTAELLNKKITKINEDNKDLTGCWNKLCIPGVMSTTTEVIEQIILRSLNNKYNINECSIWYKVQEDLKARLYLMSTSDYDTIIKEITPIIDVKKYIILPENVIDDDYSDNYIDDDYNFDD